MSLLRPFFAQTLLPTDLMPETWHWMGLTLKELLAVVGSAALITLLGVVWAVYFRKKPHRHSHYHYPEAAPRSDDSPDAESESDAESNGGGQKRYRRKRRRRREHRPRNPTLAETGGLPPLRSENPPDPLP